MREINEILDFSYENYEMIQTPSEIYNFAKFYKELNCRNILEIGSFYGGTFFVMCKLSSFNGKKISIDYPVYGGQEDALKQRRTHEKMKGFSKDTHVLVADSHQQSTLELLKTILNGEELDFIFIDGDHSYEGVKKDFEMYSPFLKDGGYVAFHDINETDEHKRRNNYVFKFWNELKQKKLEFNTKSMYMGIGVIQVYKYKKLLNIELSFEAPGKINIYNMDFSNLDVLISVRDLDTKIPIHHSSLSFTASNNGLYIIPLMDYDFSTDPNFSGFLIEIYDKNKNFIYSKELKIKDRTSLIPLVTRNYGPFDCLFFNYRQLFYDKIYDLLDLNDVKTVIDIGANVGLFSNYISWKSEVRLIHAVEPVPAPFEELKKQFYYYNHVKCHRFGIHYFDGKSEINVDPDSSIYSTFLSEHGNGIHPKIEVEVKTIPTFMDSVGLQSVDLIKMDIEGLEYEVLNCMTDDQIRRCKKWLIQYHMNEDGKADILQERFRYMGYAVENFPYKVPQYVNNKTTVQGFFFAKR